MNELALKTISQELETASPEAILRWALATRELWNYINEHDIPYNPLYDNGYASIGCAPCTTRIQIGEDARAGRWRGMEKTECGLHQ